MEFEDGRIIGNGVPGEYPRGDKYYDLCGVDPSRLIFLTYSQYIRFKLKQAINDIQRNREAWGLPPADMKSLILTDVVERAQREAKEIFELQVSPN